MLHVERRKEILNKILNEGSVKVLELSQQYGVGEATIRRDLKYLSEEYGVELTYGGAFIKGKMNYQIAAESNIFKRKTQAIREKKIIAEKAAKLINDGDIIALNAGSSVELILDYLEEIKDLSLITLSINTALRASAIPGITVYMPGGKLRSFSGAFYGKCADEFLRNFNIDKAFMGVMAVSLQKGITHGAYEEIDTNQTLYEISRKCYLIADYSKYDKVSLAKMADLNTFHGIVFDDKTPEIYKEYCRNNGIQII
ncbi:MAG: DeoR/GlpR family DNA-binding transcription regulator [Eubacteriaceae bacterium]